MMKDADIAGFSLTQAPAGDDHVLLKYLFETEADPRLASAQLCAEQSTAQWFIKGDKKDLREKFAAKFYALSPTGKPNQYRVSLAHPLINLEPNISQLLSVVMGEGPLYCPSLTAIRLEEMTLPKTFQDKFPGPQFGVTGLREQLQVFDRPIFVGVVKPNLGLDSASFSRLAYEAWLGGLDLVKDDEMLMSPSYNPLAERMRAVGEARRWVEVETGMNKIFIANLTANVHEIGARYDVACRAGANAFMLNGLFTGLSAITELRLKANHPIMCHFTGLALFHRLDNFGIAPHILVQLQRLAGADIIGLPGFGARMKTTEAEVIKNCQTCLCPQGSIKTALPIPGGSDWAGTLPFVYEKLGHPDFGFIAGRGVFGHPTGPHDGAQSLQLAWTAIKNNQTLSVASETNPALKLALEAFS